MSGPARPLTEDAEDSTASVRLERRGVVHGRFAAPPRVATPDPAAAWQRGEPVFIPGAVAEYLEPAQPLLSATLRMFSSLRNGARFLDQLAARVTDPAFRPAGCTVDRDDRREIEKVFVHAGGTDREPDARDLWAKLSWIADDESDLSLRIRFSCGHERLDEWIGDAQRAVQADRFADDVFPECGILGANPPLLDAIGSLCESRVRLSERIVYNNAPGGGAVFHHDADPGQLGVVFAQLAGRTAWLALPAHRLAEEIADSASRRPSPGLPKSPEDALTALRADPLARPIHERLNREPAFTERLIRTTNALHVLDPGDVLLLPTPTWHSVFALGNRPSLAHSFGIFAAEDDT